MKNKIGIIGAGFVGSAHEIGFEHIAEIKIYDKYKPSESLESVVEHANILFVCVPTPTDFDTGECDTSIVENVIKEILLLSKNEKCIVIKSTVPPGTTKKIQERHNDHCIVFSPEFLTEKNFIDDFKNQDRIVLGSSKIGSKEYRKLVSFYKEFIEKQDGFSEGMFAAILLECSSEEAEMFKYICNTFLATKVSFFNEIYEICKASNIDYNNTVAMLDYDNRIGLGHTKVPGPDGQFGFSGKCFPKDLNALMFFAKENGIDPLLLETVWSKNLLVRDKHDWLDIPGASTDNMKFGNKDE